MAGHIQYRVLLAIALFAGSVPAAIAQLAGESIRIERSVSEDLYLAGRHIDVMARVGGDLVVAGRRIRVSGAVAEDLIAAGESVLIEDAVGDDVRAAGRDVRLGGNVGGHVVAAGQNVTIAGGVAVADWAWLAGDSVDMSGSVGGSVKAAGRSILINGDIGGNVDLWGEDLRIGPAGRIAGSLTWHGKSAPDISGSASIGGRIIELPMPVERMEGREGGVGGFIFMFLILAVGATALFLLLPGFSRRAAVLARSEPWKCLGTGAAALFLTPLVCLLLFVTVLALLPGLVLLALYFAFLITGFLVALIAIGGFGLELAGKHESAGGALWALAIAAATVAVGLLGMIPYLGALLLFLAWLFGLGCTGLSLARGRETPVAR